MRRLKTIVNFILVFLLLILSFSLIAYHRPFLFMTDKPQWYFVKAQNLFQVGFFGKAEASLNKSLALDEDNINANKMKTNLCYFMNRNGLALRHLSFLENSTILVHKCYYNYMKGTIYLDEHNYSEAMKHYNYYLENCRNTFAFETYLGLATVHYALENFTTSYNHIKKARKYINESFWKDFLKAYNFNKAWRCNFYRYNLKICQKNNLTSCVDKYPAINRNCMQKFDTYAPVYFNVST